MRHDMDKGAKIWLARKARKEFWRVSSWYELDDLIQDGYLQYYRILDRYSHVKSPAHIMALFKRTYINHIHDLANRRTRCPDAPIAELAPPQQDESQFLENLAGGEPEGATLQTLIAQAPPAVQAALAIFLNDETCRKLRAPYRVRSTGHRETLNERLCRLTGVDPEQVDLVLAIKQHFHPTAA